MSNRCRIDAKSTPQKGRARWIRGWGPGGLCLINPSQELWLPSAYHCVDDNSQQGAIKLPLCVRVSIAPGLLDAAHQKQPIFTNVPTFREKLNQKFRKGVGGQRGLARGNPLKARDSGLFSVPFLLCPFRRRGTNFWRTFWALFGGFVCRQPPPANPLSLRHDNKISRQ